MVSFDIEDGFDKVTEKIDGKTVVFRVKQLTADEYLEFDLDMIKYRRIGARYTPERKLPDEFEKEQVTDKDGKVVLDPKTYKPVEVFKISEDRVGIRRLNEMTPDERDRYDEAQRRDETWARKFVSSAIGAYITPEPDQLEGVVTGADLARYYRGNKEALRLLLFDILALNGLNPHAKKVLQSALASVSGSNQSSPLPSGERPAPTAESVEPTDSANADAATELAATTKSSGIVAGIS